MLAHKWEKYANYSDIVDKIGKTKPEPQDVEAYMGELPSGEIPGY